MESGRLYIGKAKNLRKRYNDHKAALRRGTHYNPILQKSFNKNRKLIMELIEDVTNKLNIDEIELDYIDFYDSCNKKIGMNIVNRKLPSRPFKKIDVYDKDYNFIKTCESVKNVVKEFNVNRSSITMICKDKGYYHFTKEGYYFRYHGEPVKKYSYYKNKINASKV